MKKQLTITFALFSCILSAQVTFTPNYVSGGYNGAEPLSVFTTDIDGDGDKDIFVSSEGPVVPDNKMYWYKNLGNENFERHSLSEEYGSTLIEGIDFDGDGDIDVVSTEGDIVWFENDGMGTLTERIVPFQIGGMYPMNSGKSDIVDLDGDGDLDILLPSTTFYNISPCDDYTLFWMENDGNMNFTPISITCDEFDDANDVIAQDYDNDGDLDFVATAGCNPIKISWYENNGSEDFIYHFVEEIQTCNSGRLTKGDLNNNGNKDFLLSNSNFIYWYNNDGSGNFTKTTISSDVSGVRQISVIDMDENGNIDFVIAQGGTNSVMWFQNNGSQSFAQNIVGENIFGSASFIFTDDIDNDGDYDIISCSSGDNTISWFENDGQESFYEHQVQNKSFGASDVYGADVDGDNDIDIVSASRYDYKISWIENFNNDVYTEHVIGKIDYATAVFAIDMDNDNDIDVLGAGQYMAWYENDGNNYFTEHIVTLNTSSIETVHAIDFDGDNDVDIITDPLGIFWYENDGSQNFTEHSVYDNTGSMSVFPIDMNNDNKIDVISAFEYDNQVGIFTNDGSQNFTEQFVDMSSFNAQAVFPVDIDNDADMDIIAATGTPYSLVLFKNNANQSFSEQIITLDIFQPIAVGAGDMNNDGKADIVASGADGILAWFENDGNLSFDKKVISSNSLDDPVNLFVIDVDKDGANDVITNSMHDDQVVVFYNDIETTSINEIDFGPKLLSIFPNPISDNSNLSFIAQENGIATISIHNYLGIEVQNNHSFQLTNGINSINLNEIGLLNGIYTLSININDQLLVGKFIITGE